MVWNWCFLHPPPRHHGVRWRFVGAAWSLRPRPWLVDDFRKILLKLNGECHGKCGKSWMILPTSRKKLDDGWPESVEEQGLLLLVCRRNFRNDLWKMCYRQSRRGVSRQDSKKCKTIVCIADTLLHTLLHTKAFRHKSFYTHNLLHTVAFTQMLLHTDAFTDKGFYSQKLVHTDAFTYRHFYTDTFTHRHVYTQTLLHTKAFGHRYFDTQKLLHTDTFTHRRFYTQRLLHAQKLLHTDAFTHRDFYTHRHFLHTDAFTHRRFYTQRLLHTHRRFYTQTLSHTEGTGVTGTACQRLS